MYVKGDVPRNVHPHQIYDKHRTSMMTSQSCTVLVILLVYGKQTAEKSKQTTENVINVFDDRVLYQISTYKTGWYLKSKVNISTSVIHAPYIVLGGGGYRIHM